MSSLAVIKTYKSHWNAIDWHSEENIRALTFGALGLSSKVIEARTGLSTGQIRYRLKKNNLKLSDYRNGVGPVFDAVLARTESLVKTKVNQLLKQSGVLQIGGPREVPKGEVMIDRAKVTALRSGLPTPLKPSVGT